MAKFHHMNAQKNYLGSDERYTKAEAIYPLLKYLPKDKIIWLPCDLKSSFYVKVLKSENYKIKHSHIFEGQDFYQYEPKEWDILVTNPPFSNKKEFVERVQSFNKPYALLLPLTWLNDSAPFKLWSNRELELMIFNKRTNFLNQKQAKITFKSGYFCEKLLPKQIVWEYLQEKNLLESLQDFQVKISKGYKEGKK